MRTENSLRNISAGLAGQAVELVFSFFTRYVFLRFLSVEFLGISGLFTNVLSVLNITELGIGMAIIYALYSPLANNDQGRIKSLMQLYRKAYFFIGLIILVLGIVLIPFLPLILKGSSNLVDERIIFLLYIIETVCSYWFFAYKTALLNADQKNYISSIISYSVACAGKAIQILFLFLFRGAPVLSFYIYVIWGIIFKLCFNVIISRKVNKLYPFLKDNNFQKIPKDEVNKLIKNTFGLTLNKISSKANSSADNIIISAYIGVSVVGYYSNYTVIVAAVTHLVSTVFTSLTASIGNLYVSSTKEKMESFFNVLHLSAFWIFGFCSICLCVLLNPFITTLWIGQEYTLSNLVVYAISLNFLVDGLMAAPIRLRNACGLFWHGRYRAVIATVVNIALSIIFVSILNWGIAGVLFATIISRLCVTLLYDPYIVFKHVFNKLPYKYYLRYFRDLLLVICTGAVLQFISLLMPQYGLQFFIVRVALCLIIPNAIWYAIFRNTKEFFYIKEVALGYSRKIRSVFAKKS